MSKEILDLAETVMIDQRLILQIKSAKSALRMLAMTEMKPFTKEDWYAFSGCEDKEPMIGEIDGFTVVLDGPVLNIVHADDGYGGTLFKMKEM